MDAMQGKHFESKQAEVELQVARLLRIGSAAAAILMAVGIGMLLLGGSERIGTTVVTTGLIALVLTPVLRVFTAFIVFLRERDYMFAGISAIVLTALALGVILGRTH